MQIGYLLPRILNKNSIKGFFINIVVIKVLYMDSYERSNKKKNRDILPSNSNIPKPIWLRPFGLPIDTINRRLLDYNAYIICVGCPILYLILCLL